MQLVISSRLACKRPVWTEPVLSQTGVGLETWYVWYVKGLVNDFHIIVSQYGGFVTQLYCVVWASSQNLKTAFTAHITFIMAHLFMNLDILQEKHAGTWFYLLGLLHQVVEQ